VLASQGKGMERSFQNSGDDDGLKSCPPFQIRNTSHSPFPSAAHARHAQDCSVVCVHLSEGAPLSSAPELLYCLFNGRQKKGVAFLYLQDLNCGSYIVP
jgi:hypothetical protein